MLGMARCTSITDVARHFDLPLSTLRFWERRGLVSSHRESTRRCYDEGQLYRIALIRHWRDTGMLSIQQIGDLVATHPDTATWRRAVDHAVEGISRQVERLEAARAYLVHLRDCPHDGEPAACPEFRAMVSLPS